MPLMAGGLTTHTHAQYVIMAFLHRAVGRETRRSDRKPTETVEPLPSSMFSPPSHKCFLSLPPLGSFQFIWLVKLKCFIVSGGEKNDKNVKVIPYQLTCRDHVIFLKKISCVKTSIKLTEPCRILSLYSS